MEEAQSCSAKLNNYGGGGGLTLPVSETPEIYHHIVVKSVIFSLFYIKICF